MISPQLVALLGLWFYVLQDKQITQAISERQQDYLCGESHCYKQPQLRLLSIGRCY